MPEVSRLRQPKLVTAEVDVEGELVTITFDKNAVTLNWAAEAKRAHVESDAKAIAATLAAVIHEWDITADGEPFPPTPDNLADLPAEVLGRLTDSIETASAPSRAEGNASSAPSSIPPSGFTEPPQTPQNGVATSPLPPVSAGLSTR